MIKEYLQENLDILDKKKETLLHEKERLTYVKERLYDNIVEIQQKSDVDFAIFSPRINENSSKNKLNEMYVQMGEIKKQIGKIVRGLEEISAERERFQMMLDEVNRLIKNQKSEE